MTQDMDTPVGEPPLPPLPPHPWHRMPWTESERKTICEYGERCWRAALAAPAGEPPKAQSREYAAGYQAGLAAPAGEPAATEAPDETPLSAALRAIVEAQARALAAPAGEPANKLADELEDFRRRHCMHWKEAEDDGLVCAAIEALRAAAPAGEPLQASAPPGDAERCPHGFQWETPCASCDWPERYPAAHVAVTDRQLEQLFDAVYEFVEFGREWRERARQILAAAPAGEPER